MFEDLNIDESVFTHNAFAKISDPEKKIVVLKADKKLLFPYVTNTVFRLDDNGTFFAVCELENSKIFGVKDLPNKRLLLLSGKFKYNDKVYRTGYKGLLPGVFRWSMLLEETCEVEDNEGNKYTIYIE